MKVLVTGVAGFIASHTADYLYKNYDVLGIDNFANSDWQHVRNECEFIQLDLTNKHKVFEAFKDTEIDYIIHLAARNSVPKSIENPHETFRNNVLATQVVVELAIEKKVKKLLFSSSSSVFGDENGKIISPYGISKYLCEELIRKTCTYANIPYCILRYFNVFGPRQKKGPVVSTWIDNFLSGEPCISNGDPKERSRDFTFVKDVAWANKTFIENKYEGVYNIGYGKPVTLELLYYEILNHTKEYSKCIVKEERVGDIKHSNAETKTNIDWIGFNKGLKETVKWYRENKQ